MINNTERIEYHKRVVLDAAHDLKIDANSLIAVGLREIGDRIFGLAKVIEAQMKRIQELEAEEMNSKREEHNNVIADVLKAAMEIEHEQKV
jgi:hypothetical protein